MGRFRSNFRRWAADLLDQQLWCWGRDVARPEGNVLLEIGMSRFRSPEPHCASMYKATLEGDAEVRLWGFGLLYSEPGVGDVFLRRFGRDPMLAERPPEAPVHSAKDIGPLVSPAGARRASAAALVRGAAKWIARYEHWVAESLGIDYRQGALAARDRPPAVPAEGMAAGWERVAQKSPRLFAPERSTGPWGPLLASLRFYCDSFTAKLAGGRPGRHPPQGRRQPQRGVRTGRPQ